MQLRGIGRSVRARGSAPRTGTPRARATRAVVGLLLLAPYLTGCYHYVPVRQSLPPVGANVTLRLTDQGRVSLAEVLGPGALDVRGHVLANTDTSLVLAVRTVNYMDLGIPARWDGQPVELPRMFTTDVREKRLSKPRSFLAAGLVLGLIVAASTLGLGGYGADLPGQKPGDDGGGNQS